MKIKIRKSAVMFLAGALCSAAFVEANAGGALARDGESVIVENGAFRLVLSVDGAATSLVVKATGEECLASGVRVPFARLRQDRPYDNEMHLLHPARPMWFNANRIVRKGDLLEIGFAHEYHVMRVGIIATGDYVAFDSDFLRFGEGKRRVKAKAIDDRIGCAQMIKLMEQDLPMDVTFVFTVQEEVGLRGAKAAAFNLRPDIALVLEGTTSADMPGVDDAKKVTRVGGGCVIGCVDTGTIYDHKLFDALRNMADEAGIPWQIKNYIAGGTDAAVIQRSRAGVRVANISTPVRMLHAASTVADKNDMEHGLKLAQMFIDAIAAGKVK